MTRRRTGIQKHHVIGAGVIASALGVYHFASQNGILGTRPSADSSNAAVNSAFMPGVPNPTGNNTSNPFGAAPTGLPVGYNNNTGYYNGSPAVNNGYTNTQYNQPANTQYPNPSRGDIQVYFSPKGGCTDAIVRELNQARQVILVQAYSFTSAPIAAACVAAHNRGVTVIAVLDKSQETEQYSSADYLVNSGINTVIDSEHQIAHNKVILVDGQTLITGSFNFTKNAEQNNAENLLIIRNHPELYAAYEANIRHHYEHSKQHVGRGTVRESNKSTYQRRR